MKIEFLAPQACSVIVQEEDLWLQVTDEIGKRVDVEIHSTTGPIVGYRVAYNQRRERVENLVLKDCQPALVRLMIRDNLEEMTLIIRTDKILKFYVTGTYKIDRETPGPHI